MDALNPSPVASGGQMPLSPEPKHGVGPLVGTVVVIILLGAGALYFWGSRMNNQEAAQEVIPYIPSEEISPAGDSDTVSGLPPQGQSDDAAAIEADLEAMDFERFDAQIESDLRNFDEDTE